MDGPFWMKINNLIKLIPKGIKKFHSGPTLRQKVVGLSLEDNLKEVPSDYFIAENGSAVASW